MNPALRDGVAWRKRWDEKEEEQVRQQRTLNVREDLRQAGFVYVRDVAWTAPLVPFLILIHSAHEGHRQSVTAFSPALLWIPSWNLHHYPLSKATRRLKVCHL